MNRYYCVCGCGENIKGPQWEKSGYRAFVKARKFSLICKDCGTSLVPSGCDEHDVFYEDDFNSLQYDIHIPLGTESRENIIITSGNAYDLSVAEAIKEMELIKRFSGKEPQISLHIRWRNGKKVDDYLSPSINELKKVIKEYA